MNIVDFKKLTTIERLQAMEALWNLLLYEDESLEAPDWHERILEDRKKSIASGKAKFISLAELKASRKQ
jgi:hypothetical protein